MKSENLILVMGVTGAGKSHFINQLKPDSVIEGHGLGSQTKTCQLVKLRIGASTVAVIDTPGFDDDEDSDTVVLAKITSFLTTQYHLGISLKGIIFLHRINSPRFSGSERRYLNTFRQICGEHAFSNVALVTTMWDTVDQTIGLRRENELQRAHWADLISKGSYVFQHNGTSDMARTIVGQMMTKDDVVLEIQQQLSDDSCELNHTSAGAELASDLDTKLKERRRVIQNLNIQLQEAESASDISEIGQVQSQLRVERNKQLKQIRARDVLGQKVGEETKKTVEQVKKEKRARGERWKSRLELFAEVLGRKMGVIFHF
ncbi:P-loop containing nucleoside triphosphate hydrolase protein [Phaeosphaeriaceae sp. PMI808]|nr:P-loop containing nucleoside triphosphate hydrolase protein [Phaeosphaeriaceae sp. PMI808]